MPAKNEQPKEPEKLFAIASPHSLGGVSMFDSLDELLSFFRQQVTVLENGRPADGLTR